MDCRILVIGASGFIGHRFLQLCQQRGLSAVGTQHHSPIWGSVGGGAGGGSARGNTRESAGPGAPLECDVRAWAEVAQVMDAVAPTHVVMAAGVAIHGDDPARIAEARAVHVDGVRHVVEEAARVGARVVLLSSAQVFDGTSPEYFEGDAACPNSTLGLQQLCAEHIVAVHGGEHLIIRTTDVFDLAICAGDLVWRTLDGLDDGGVELHTDRITTPTPRDELVDSTLELIQGGKSGIYHVAGREWTSHYEFGVAVAQALERDSYAVHPVCDGDSDSDSEHAPHSTRLNITRTEQALGRRLASYRGALAPPRRRQRGR